MSAPVLAVLRRRARNAVGSAQAEAEAVLDAVAELIAKAADKVADGCPCDSCEALRVAIRNCGGEA